MRVIDDERDEVYYDDEEEEPDYEAITDAQTGGSYWNGGY